MSTNPAPTPTLHCKECAYENEPERVYCHNCGAKLDRSLLPKEEQLRRESPDKARKRIMRMANPAQSRVRRELGALVKTLIFSLLAAALVQALRAPATVPPTKSDAPARLLASDLGDLVASPTPRAGRFFEAEINSYLRTGKITAQNSVPGVEFKRAYVDLEPGTARIVLEKAVWGYSLYLGALYRVEATNKTFIHPNLGGNVGRLPIHPLIMDRLAPMLFGKLAEAMSRELKSLEQMQSIVVRKDVVDVVSAGVSPKK